MNNYLRDEIQIAMELASGMNKQRWINVLSALDAERQEHAKEVANLKARGDSYSNLYLEACNYLADLRQRIAELEAHPYREYQLQIARLLHTEEKEEKP